MGHLYTGLCDNEGLSFTMLENWEIEHAVEDNDIGKAIPNQHLRRNRECFSTPHTVMMIAFITFKSSLVPLFEGL